MSDREDALSAEMAAAEMETAEQSLRDMAPELAIALKAAHRIILAVPNDVEIPRAVWLNNWPVVDEVVNRLVELQDG